MRPRLAGRSVVAGLGALTALLVAALLAPGMLAAPPPPPPNRPAPPATSKAQDPATKLLDEGWNQLELVNYPAAERAFGQLLDSNPPPKQHAEALFGLGYLWQYRQPGQDIPRAREYYALVASKFKDTPAGPLALLAMARLDDMPPYEKDRKKEQARQLYRKVISLYPEHFAAEEAVHRLATTYLEELTNPASITEGVRLLREHLAKHPDSFLAPVMHLQLGGACYDRKEYRQAVEHWTTADELDAKAGKDRAMDRSMMAAVYFRIAKVAEKRLQDYDLAIKWYDRIINEIKRDNKFYVSKLSVERCRKLAQEARGKAGVTTAPAAAPATVPASAPAAGKEGPNP